jgi:hypothetical protein
VIYKAVFSSENTVFIINDNQMNFYDTIKKQTTGIASDAALIIFQSDLSMAMGKTGRGSDRLS